MKLLYDSLGLGYVPLWCLVVWNLVTLDLLAALGMLACVFAMFLVRAELHGYLVGKLVEDLGLWFRSLEEGNVHLTNAVGSRK